MGTLPLFIIYSINISGIQYFPGYLFIMAALIGYVGLIYLKKRSDTNNIPRISKANNDPIINSL